MMITTLLDLNDDVLNIIGDYVKKDNLEEEIKKGNEWRTNIKRKKIMIW